MARKNKAFLENIKKQYKTYRLWSWSRVNCYINSQYEYYLKYIINETEDRTDGIYAIQGNICHNIIEDFYSNKIQFADMIKRYEEELFNLQLGDYKYDRTDDKKNEAISSKYENSIRNFFKTHNVIKDKMMLEQFIVIDLEKNIFQGYIDCLVRDKDDNIHIIDWKTSSIYTGEKAIKEAGQLMLYAIGLSQKNIPLEKIKIGWNFLKYITLEYKLKNGKIKSSNILRCENWMEKPSIYKSIISNAENLKLDLEYIKKCISENTFNLLPNEIKEFYTIKDCYIYVDIDEVILNNFKTKILSILKDIKYKELDGREDVFMDDVTDKDSYYFYNLCGYSRKKHKPFNKYLENIEMFLD